MYVDQANQEVKATSYGVPISQYYPRIRFCDVVLGAEVSLDCDIGSYEKGSTLNDSTSLSDLFLAMISTMEDMKETIAVQQRRIQELQDDIEEGGGPGVTLSNWPDISEINGGGADDLGDNGGDDVIHL